MASIIYWFDSLPSPTFGAVSDNSPGAIDLAKDPNSAVSSISVLLIGS